MAYQRKRLCHATRPKTLYSCGLLPRTPSVEIRHPRERCHPTRSPSAEERHPHWRSPVSNMFPAHVRYSDIPSETRKSAVVEHHMKQASTKAINQDRRRSMSVDKFQQDRRKSSEGGNSRPIDRSVTVPWFDGSGDLELFLKRFKSVAQYYC